MDREPRRADLMAEDSSQEVVLIRWSKHLPTADVQDPLGLSLRGIARLGSTLLYCVTSISPRARYFSFIPWCVYNFQTAEKGKPYATGLEEAIVLRERALALGCVVHHDGKPCLGGNLVGSEKAKTWHAKHPTATADLRKLEFNKNPAYRAYRSPLINLGVFITDDELPQDEEGEQPERTFENLQLSTLGLKLAQSYASAVEGLAAIRQITSPGRECSTAALKELGKRGGLCEITSENAPDRKLLRDILFCREGLSDGSHQLRRRSMLLMLELFRQLSSKEQLLDEARFADAVYFGEVQLENSLLKIRIPDRLHDISDRWRMFYFHFYMGVALEAMFSWLVADLANAGLSGRSLDDMVRQLKQKAVQSDLKSLFGYSPCPSISEATPASLLNHFGVPIGELSDSLSRSIDLLITRACPASEPSVEGPLWRGEVRHSPTGLLLPMLLLSVTLARYKQWEQSPHGNWLAAMASDPYVDLIPPVVLTGLNAHFGDWWNHRLEEVTRFVLSRYVVQQHLSMSYERTAAGDRCLLHVDGNRITCSGSYDKIGLGNGRFRSARQILIDLSLVKHDTSRGLDRLTVEGRQLLADELGKEESA